MLKHEFNIDPAKVDKDISEYAKCLGLVRIVPCVVNDSFVFCPDRDIEDPRHTGVYMLVEVYCKLGSNDHCFYIVSDSEVYRMTHCSGSGSNSITFGGNEICQKVKCPQDSIDGAVKAILDLAIQDYRNSLG